MNPELPPTSRSGPDADSGESGRLWIYLRVVLFLVLAGPLVYLTFHWKDFFDRYLETDPLALLPEEKGVDPNVRAQVALAGKMTRAALVRVTGREEMDGRTGAGSSFVEAARESGLFVEVISLQEDQWMPGLLHGLRELRLPMLFPLWLEQQRFAYEEAEPGNTSFPAFAALRAVQGLDRFLDRADVGYWEEWLPWDPLLLVPTAMETSALAVEFSEAVSADEEILWLWLAPGVFETNYRQALEDFLEVQSREHEVEATGAFAFAGAGERRMKREIQMLAVLTSLILGLIVFVFLRQPGYVIVVCLNILFSFSGAVLFTALVGGKLHLVSFVFALLFGGLAADYTLHPLIKKETLGASSFRQTLRSIRRPWFGIGFTTILGFLTLVLLGFPALQQAGIMVATGVVLSLVFNLLFFTLRDDWLGKSTRPVTRYLRWQFPAPMILLVPALGISVLIVGIFHFSGIVFREDIADLQPPLPGLMERDQGIREAAGTGRIDRGLVSAGDDWDRAVLALRAAPADGLWHMADLLPTKHEFLHAGAFLAENPDWAEFLAEGLREAEFDPASFDPFFASFQGYREGIGTLQLPDVLDSVESALQGPARILLTRENDQFHLVSLAERELLAEELPDGAAPLDYGAAISAILTQYRGASTLAITCVFGVLAVAPLVVFPWRIGVVVTGLAAAAVGCAFSFLLLVEDSISLFHLAGLLVGVCLAMDYLFFSAASRPGEAPSSIRLAVFSTFGVAVVLSTSQIPAVSAVSLAIAATVAAGYLAAEVYVGVKSRRAGHA